jgi:MFS family permease
MPHRVALWQAIASCALTACWWMVSNLVVYYSIYGLFATWLQTQSKLAPATPVLLSNLAVFIGSPFWGGVADRIGVKTHRRMTLHFLSRPGVMIAPIVPSPEVAGRGDFVEIRGPRADL